MAFASFKHTLQTACMSILGRLWVGVFYTFSEIQCSKTEIMTSHSEYKTYYM